MRLRIRYKLVCRLGLPVLSCVSQLDWPRLASPRLVWSGLAWSDLAGLLWLWLWLWLWSVSVCTTAMARVSARVSRRTSYISFKQEHATNAVQRQRQRDFLPGAGTVRDRHDT